MSNILLLARAIKLADSKTALESTARNLDSENLWPIVKDVLDSPWHIQFVKVEEVEAFSARFETYLNSLSFKGLEEKPQILTVVTACLLRMSKALLHTPNPVSLEEIPVTQALFDSHLFNYDQNCKYIRVM